MIAYLKGEAGAHVIYALLDDPENVCYAHSVNLCEVYYDFLRNSDEATARQAISDLLADGIIERRDMSQRFWRRAGQIKARGRISLADCFCIALAQHLSAEIVTSDRKEFEPLVQVGLCAVTFIR